jgi:ankyrin repeat protein
MAEGTIDLGKEFISLCCQDVFDDSVLEGLSSILTQSNSSLVDVPDKDGMTPLMHAAYKGRLKLCQFLLDNGANVNSDMQSEGYTPLMFATIAGHSQIVQLLLNRGAKVDMTNKVNRTASQMGGFVGIWLWVVSMVTRYGMGGIHGNKRYLLL